MVDMLKRETQADYQLVGSSCWITVKNLSIHVVKCADGVVVNIYSLNREMEDPFATIMALYAREEDMDDDDELC